MPERFMPKFLFFSAIIILLSLNVFAQQNDSPVIVQPGAPGQPTRVLPADTKGKLPPASRKDVEFMQGMIHHHAQAVEMTALIEARTENAEIRRLGARISQSQSEEMNFMKRWLEVRGEKTMMEMSDSDDKYSSGLSNSKHEMMMPGMLTKEQMNALKNAKGAEFDKLFLQGMIQHHKGALVMVEELFKAGGGQDGEIFNFATDVDSGQRAEIKRMQTLLGEKP
jgi:uncharacterized protein (DUF305 family)